MLDKRGLAPSSPLRERRGRWPTTSARWCSTAPGGRSSPSSAWTAIPRRAMPATCCCPTRRPSSACARRRRSTPRSAAQAIKQALEADPPYGAEVAFEGRRRTERLARAAAGALAREGGGAGLAGSVRQAGRLHGRRRHDPLHGHAGREVPRHPVRHHRRAGPALQCAWPQRIPAHSRRASASRWPWRA